VSRTHLSLLSVFVFNATVVAADPMRPQAGSSPGPMTAPFHREVVGIMSNGTCSNCESNCGSDFRHRNFLARLIDLLTFRPTIPCDRRPVPTGYEPPGYTYFPRCCHANDGSRGCATGCNSCASCNHPLAKQSNRTHTEPVVQQPFASPARSQSIGTIGWNRPANTPAKPSLPSGFRVQPSVHPPQQRQ
jgi:hypothetical protein